MSTETATFPNRRSLHDEALEVTEQRLKAAGLLVARFGQENILPAWAMDELRGRTEKTATYLRFQPDLLVFRRPVGVWPAEVKSCSGRNRDTPFFAYELASYDTLIRLYRADVRTFVVFNGTRAQWGWLLDFERTFEQPREETGGSRTPYGLIRKESIPFLDEFVRNDLHPAERAHAS